MALWTQRLLKNLQASNLYKTIISMQNKQEWVAWSVGLSQLFKEPLVHSMHFCFTVYINFSCWNKGSNSIHRQIALGTSETAKSESSRFIKQLHPLAHVQFAWTPPRDKVQKKVRQIKIHGPFTNRSSLQSVSNIYMTLYVCKVFCILHAYTTLSLHTLFIWQRNNIRTRRLAHIPLGSSHNHVHEQPSIIRETPQQSCELVNLEFVFPIHFTICTMLSQKTD